MVLCVTYLLLIIYILKHLGVGLGLKLSLTIIWLSEVAMSAFIVEVFVDFYSSVV